MAMELLEGRDLKDLIAQEPALATWTRSSTSWSRSATGWPSPTPHDLIHRDLKPANIHVQPSGQVKILDFGLARFSTSEMTRTGMVMGTPHYMSPEQVRGEKVDARSDIFSLGAVFYELLSGHKPFDGDSMHTVLFHVMQDDPQPLRKWVDVPPMLVELVERALIKDPTRRFQRAVHLGDGMRAVRNALAEGREAEATLDSDGVGPGVRPSSEAPRSARRRAAQSSAPKRATVGAVALDPARRARCASLEKTRRPLPTLSGRSSTQVARAREAQAAVARFPSTSVRRRAWSCSRGPAGPCTVPRPRSVPPPVPATPDAGQQQIGVLTEALVANQVQLARKKLDDKSYAAAASQAERALKLDPKSVEAKKVLEEAQGVIKGLEAAGRRGAGGNRRAGRRRGPPTALWKLLSADPNYAEAGGSRRGPRQGLPEPSAEEARRLMDQSQVAAERANATSVDAFTEAVGQAKDRASTVRERGLRPCGPAIPDGARRLRAGARRSPPLRTLAGLSAPR